MEQNIWFPKKLLSVEVHRVRPISEKTFVSLTDLKAFDHHAKMSFVRVLPHPNDDEGIDDEFEEKVVVSSESVATRSARQIKKPRKKRDAAHKLHDITNSVSELIKFMGSYSLIKKQVLPFFSVPASTKKTLVLDLDETLIHLIHETASSTEETFKSSKIETVNMVNERNEMKEMKFIIRPYAISLLKTLSQKYEIVIFSAAQLYYIHAICDVLDPEGKCITHFLSREECSIICSYYVKDISRFKDRKLSDIVIVDDKIVSFALHLHNGIAVSPFNGDIKDQELKHLTELLLKIYDLPDLRVGVEKYMQLDKLLSEASLFSFAKKHA